MSKQIEDLTGQKFNKLLAIKPALLRPYKATKWLFKCDCGNEKEIIGSFVKNGYTISCGCAKKDNNPLKTSQALIRPKGEAGSDLFWSNLKYQAKKRNKEFSLLKKDIFDLCSKNCYYCNSEPSQISEINISKYGNLKTQKHGRFIHNGLDRINNDVGYVKTNVVSCCSICNFAKNTLTTEEFFSWIKSLHNNLKAKKLIE